MNRTLSSFRRVAPWLAMAVVAHATDAPQSLDAIRAIAESYVRAQIPGSAENAEVTMGALDPRLRLAACSTPLQASLPPGATLRERATVGVSCRGSVPWTVYVPVSIESNIAVLVLRRSAARGARLSAADIETQTRRVAGTDASYLTNVTQLTGRTLKRPLPAGTPLTADSFVEDLLIHRGQQVTLIASAGGLEVRATGRALSDARTAERVRVQNSSSQRVVEGVAESANVIRVTP